MTASDPTDAAEVPTPDPSLNDDCPQLAEGQHLVATVPAWHNYIEVRANGTVLFDEAIIGRAELDPDGKPRLILNLGWLKAVGMGITLQNDPDVDTQRNGFVIQRPAPGEAPEPF